MKRSGKLPIFTIIAGGLLLLIGVVLIWKVSITSANRNRLKAIAARGEPVDAAALDKFYKAVPDTENAALVWLTGVDEVMPDPGFNSSNWPQITLPPRGTSPDQAQLQYARGLISSNAEALASFRRAASLSQSRYPANLTVGLLVDLGHLGKLKSAAQVLRVETLVAIESDDSERAVDGVKTILAAGRSLASEPIILSQLVRYGIDTVAFKTAEFMLNRARPSDSNLQELTAEFAKADDAESLSLGFMGERAIFVSCARDPKVFLSGGAPPNSTIEETLEDAFAWPIFRATGLLQRDLRFGIDALTTNIALSRLPDPKKFLSRTNAEHIEIQARDGYYILTALLLPALNKSFARDATHRAQARIAQLVLAIERHRLAKDQVPADLSALVPNFLKALPLDPFDGQPLRFKLLESGYVVYSIGADGKDDGGLEKPPKAPKGAPEDITFIVERPEKR